MSDIAFCHFSMKSSQHFSCHIQDSEIGNQILTDMSVTSYVRRKRVIMIFVGQPTQIFRTNHSGDMFERFHDAEYANHIS